MLFYTYVILPYLLDKIRFSDTSISAVKNEMKWVPMFYDTYACTLFYLPMPKFTFLKVKINTLDKK